MLLCKGKNFSIICQYTVQCTPFIIQTILNNICKFLYISKMVSDISFAHNKAIILYVFKIFFIKTYLPIEWNIATFDN